MPRLGMDVDAVESIGHQMIAKAASLGSVGATAGRLIQHGHSLWQGNTSRHWFDQWIRDEAAVRRLAQDLDAMGRNLLAQAKEQRDASRGEAFGSAVLNRLVQAEAELRAGVASGVTNPFEWLGGVKEGLIGWGVRHNGQLIVPGDVSDWELRIRYNQTDRWRLLDGHGTEFKTFHWLNKASGAIGTVTSFADGAMAQWEKDLSGKGTYHASGDQALDTGLLISRASVTGGTTALGAMGGAAAGAALGSIIPGPGTAVGAVVGGVVGGVAGTSFGQAAGGVINDATTYVGNQLGSFLYDLGTNSASTASAVAKAGVSFFNPKSWWGSHE